MSKKNKHAESPRSPQQAAAQDLFQQAARYHQSGMLMQADASYREVLRLDPRHADALHMLGMLANQLGQNDEAIAWLTQAIKANKNVAFFHHNLGSVYQDVGKLDDAAACYRHALRLKPDLAASHNNLGNTLYQQGKFKDALPNFERALRLAPGNAEWHFNYAMALRMAGKPDDAIDHFRQALHLNPDYIDAHLNLATCYRDKKMTQEAIDSYQAVLRYRPDYVALCNLARLYRDRSDIAAAKSCYEQALELQADDGCKFKLALLFPIVPASCEEMRKARQEYEDRLEWLAQQDLRLHDPSVEVGETPFLLAYQGCNDVALQTRLAGLYEKASPELLYTAPHCRQPQPSSSGKIRIGFVSSYLWEHSVGGSMRGIIANLARDRFEVHVFFFSKPVMDETARAIRAAADHAEILPENLAQARERIAARELDILFYPEIGMDPLTYFLAFARLAPVQCVTWGHLDTTGIANVDYYISNADAEPEDGDTHYSEKLVRIENSAMFPCYPRPADGTAKTRANYGLDEAAHLYICPQSLFKLHPEFDAILLRILRDDPLAKLILPENKPHWRQLLLRRLSASLDGIENRIIWMPWQDRAAYRDWIRLSDVMLDPIHYGGGVSSLDGFPTGTPIVTWPGPFMRGRFTYACYRRMGILECLAKDVEDYAAKALRLANDPQYRAEIKQAILDKHDVLFDDLAGLRRLEAFLLQAARTPGAE